MELTGKGPGGGGNAKYSNTRPPDPPTPPTVPPPPTEFPVAAGLGDLQLLLKKHSALTQVLNVSILMESTPFLDCHIYAHSYYQHYFMLTFKTDFLNS